MANIPIERKEGGVPWWLWLLGLLLLGLLAAFLLGLFDNEDEVTVDDDRVEETTPLDDGDADTDGAVTGTGAPIIVLDDLYDNDNAALGDGAAGTGSADTDGRIGRTVTLTNARVLNVVSDSAFYVGADDDRRVLVVLEGLGEGQSGQNPEGSDGRFNIDTGDDVSINGTVRAFAQATRGIAGLAEADRTAMMARGVYVAVTSAGDVRGADTTTENDAAEGATDANANTADSAATN